MLCTTGTKKQRPKPSHAKNIVPHSFSISKYLLVEIRMMVSKTLKTQRAQEISLKMMNAKRQKY